ncbi:NfeD family protein [Candidatus Hydrogenedentota bacterium]
MFPPGIIVAGLFGAGLAMILCEVFVPGGFLGILGIGCVVASMVFSFMFFPDYAGYIFTGELIGVIATMILAFKIASKRLVLRDVQEAGIGDKEAELELRELVGAEGIADTVLRPSGMAEIGTRRISVVTEGEFLDKDARIKVIHADGNKVVVRAVEDE